LRSREEINNLPSVCVLFRFKTVTA